MSALPPKADMFSVENDVRFVPEADMVSRVATLGSAIRAQLHRRATHVCGALERRCTWCFFGPKIDRSLVALSRRSVRYG